MFSCFSRKKHANQEHDEIEVLRDAVEPLLGRNSIYATDACLKRILERCNWNLILAWKMLEEIRWNEVARGNKHRKVVPIKILSGGGGSVGISWISGSKVGVCGGTRVGGGSIGSGGAISGSGNVSICSSNVGSSGGLAAMSATE